MRTLVSPQGSRYKLTSFTKGVLVGCTGLLVYGLILIKFASPYVSIKWKDSTERAGGALDSAARQTPRPFNSDMRDTNSVTQADKLQDTLASKPPPDDPAMIKTEFPADDATTRQADTGERLGSDGRSKTKGDNENGISVATGQCTIAIDTNVYTLAHTCNTLAH